MAWLTGYSYRKSHDIHAATGAGANYPIKITVYAGAGTDSVDKVYLNNHGVDASFGDIRFTDDDGSTELSYWMESHVDSDNAVFWVKVTDSLETNPQTIYIYYGKAATSTTSSGINTFIFFEDFNALNDGDLNGQNSWSGDTGADVQTTTVKEGAKACQIAGDIQEIDHTVTIENGYKIFVQLYMRSNNTPEARVKYPCNMYIMQGATQISAVAILDSTNWTPNVEIDHLRDGPAWQKVAGALVNTWYKLKLALLSTTTHAVWIDDVFQTLGTTANSTVTTGVTKIRIERYDGSAGSLGFFDQIVVGKYVSPEPVQHLWGNEEVPAVAHYLTITEIIGCVDSKSRIKTINRTITEVLGALDTKSRIKTINRTITEVLGLKDFPHGIPIPPIVSAAIGKIKHVLLDKFLGWLEQPAIDNPRVQCDIKVSWTQTNRVASSIRDFFTETITIKGKVAHIFTETVFITAAVMLRKYKFTETVQVKGDVIQKFEETKTIKADIMKATIEVGFKIFGEVKPLVEYLRELKRRIEEN